MTGPAIEVENLTKAFGDYKAVDGINFTVRQGEIFAFLGPNGAGKSTTIQILCTLLRPSGGRAVVSGFDVEQEPDRVRAAIGIIFQDYSLDNYLTADQNLRYHCMIYHVPKTLREERTAAVLELVGLIDRRHQLVRNFSGGMKRRLELARGLLHRPRVLFLDEPTVGLDPQTRLHIWEYIVELKDRFGTTVFMTTHYMDEAEYADRIAIIDRGRVVALDTPARLKDEMGGDLVFLSTTDDQLTMEELSLHFGLQANLVKDGVVFKIKDGEGFLLKSVEMLTPRIKRTSIKHPSLDDVFLQLTGQAIRQAESGGSKGHRRSRVRRGR